MLCQRGLSKALAKQEKNEWTKRSVLFSFSLGLKRNKKNTCRKRRKSIKAITKRSMTCICTNWAHGMQSLVCCDTHVKMRDRLTGLLLYKKTADKWEEKDKRSKRLKQMLKCVRLATVSVLCLSELGSAALTREGESARPPTEAFSSSIDGGTHLALSDTSGLILILNFFLLSSSSSESLEEKKCFSFEAGEHLSRGKRNKYYELCRRWRLIQPSSVIEGRQLLCVPVCCVPV